MASAELELRRRKLGVPPYVPSAPRESLVRLCPEQVESLLAQARAGAEIDVREMVLRAIAENRCDAVRRCAGLVVGGRY